MAKAKIEIPEDRLKLYDDLVAGNPDIERKGKTTPYTSLNGHMFTFLAKDGTMGLRLSKEDREQFLQTHDTELMEQHGRIMKEYVRVPGALLEDTDSMKGYLAQSHAYVKTLKPKK